MAGVSFGHGQPGWPPTAARPAAPVVYLQPWGPRAATVSGWSLPGPRAVEPASCAAGGGSWGHPDPQWMGGSCPPGPASLPRNRLGCSWAQGRAGPTQHLTPVIACLRRVLATCFRRSICASRQGPRATFGCICVDSVSKSGETHGPNLGRGALGWAMSLSFTRSCTRPLETEIKSNFGSLFCEMCGNGTQVQGGWGRASGCWWHPPIPCGPLPS